MGAAAVPGGQRVFVYSSGDISFGFVESRAVGLRSGHVYRTVPDIYFFCTIFGAAGCSGTLSARAGAAWRGATHGRGGFAFCADSRDGSGTFWSGDGGVDSASQSRIRQPQI